MIPIKLLLNLFKKSHFGKLWYLRSRVNFAISHSLCYYKDGRKRYWCMYHMIKDIFPKAACRENWMAITTALRSEDREKSKVAYWSAFS